MLLRDFATDEETGIALPPREVPPAGYLDGAERYLFERLPGVADRSTGSEELQGLVHDWPTLYHLTPYRATIFDCLAPVRGQLLGPGGARGVRARDADRRGRKREQQGSARQDDEGW